MKVWLTRDGKEDDCIVWCRKPKWRDITYSYYGYQYDGSGWYKWYRKNSQLTVLNSREVMDYFGISLKGGPRSIREFEITIKAVKKK